MSSRDDEIRVRPGRIRDKNFVGEVTRAAKKAGHVGKRFGRRGRASSGFGRGRRAALASFASQARRVTVQVRVVRHQGKRFRAMPLTRYMNYLRRDGVTKDGSNALMFDAQSDTADDQAFAGRCKDDRHHFRIMISPEDAPDMADLRAFTREYMSDVERDLGTRLDWVAVDHWNTSHPHIHILVRGRTDKDQDLVISRNYISQGLRQRASERVTLELGPRTEQQIRNALEREVDAERWTGLDRALARAAEEGLGVINLRPGTPDEDPELRRLMLGRIVKLERLGLAESTATGCWTLKPGMEQTLRDLAIRDDIIAMMHRAMRAEGKEPDVSGFAMHSGTPEAPVLGKLVERGLHDEMAASAYAIVAGIDGRTHHLTFGDIALTGDCPTGAVVETRAYTDAKGRPGFALAVRSDLSIEDQVNARGATWLDRQLIAKETNLSHAGFGAEARDAMTSRSEHLLREGLARRQGQRLIFARDLIATLRDRELEEARTRITADTGRVHSPLGEGDTVAGIYRQRLTLASGRFAMIDDGMGFALVPWRPALEQYLGQDVRGRVRSGGIEWSFERERGLSL